METLVNIDVPDLARAEAFYTAAFGLRPARRFGAGVVELVGADSAIYLLQKEEGSTGAARSLRDYHRHWTPLHLDFVVDDIEEAAERLVKAGGMQETPIRKEAWGKIATFGDPFGHGLCLIQFLGRGYDEIAD